MKLKNILFASGILVSISQLNAANVLLNGDFEAGLTGSHNYNIPTEIGNLNYGPPNFGSTMPTGWTRSVVGAGAGGRGWVVTDLGEPTTAFASGDYAYRLDGATNNGVDSIIQSGIGLTSGQIVTLSFDAFLDGNAGTNEVLARLTGPVTIDLLGAGTLLTRDGSSEPVTSASFAITTSGTYTFEIYADQSTTSNHIIVDNLVLNAVPEPSSTALLGIGGLALILRRRK
ncbi:hypothetical protein NT6N_20250 [Oceaniferula spumae]|uniref:Ice-binding protein C-terminal domain-containing protein n=1 Tax=Oceaniferula spumae TaxID=2979115 RepID=A0AAT9FLU4_9BACT